jgi:hypothetical protein
MWNGRMVSIIWRKKSNTCQLYSNIWCVIFHNTFLVFACFLIELSMSLSSADDEDVSSEQPAAVSSGSLLCRALVGAIDAVLTKPPEQFFVMKAAVVNAMKSLLAVSSTAKSTALEGINNVDRT